MAPGDIIKGHFEEQAEPTEDTVATAPVRSAEEILQSLRDKIGAKAEQDSNIVELTFTHDDAPVLEALRNLAASDLGAFKFEQLAKSVLKSNGTAEDLAQRLHPKAIESLGAFLDQGGNVSLHVSDLIRTYCPTKAQLHAEKPDLAKQYAKLPKVKSMQDEWIIANSEVKKPSASAIPFQEQRWAFIEKANAQLAEWQPAIEEALEKVPA